MNPVPDPARLEVPVTHIQLIRVVSRTIAVFLLYWAFSTVMALPREVIAVAHYTSTQPSSGTYWITSYTSEILGGLIRMVVLAFIGMWFYRCGPRIQRFFSA